MKRLLLLLAVCPLLALPSFPVSATALSAAMRARLRAQHAQTQLIAGQGITNLHSQQRMLDRLQVPTAKGQIIVQRSPQANVGDTNYRIGDPASPVTVFTGPGSDGADVWDHELGHAFSARNLTPQARQQYMALRHMQPQDWYGTVQPGGGRATPTGDANIPEEDFAEVYRILGQHADLLNSHRAWHRYRTETGSFQYLHSAPTYFQARKLLKLIRSLG